MVCLVTLPIKQLEDAIVSVNQSGSRKMMPPLQGARDKLAPFAQNFSQSMLRHFENRELIENLTKLLSRKSKELTKNNWQAVLIEGEENNKLFFSEKCFPNCKVMS